MKHFTLSLKWLFLCLCLTAGSQAWGQTTYKLVTNDNQLSNGDVIIIASGTSGSCTALGAANGANNRKSVDVTVSNDTITTSVDNGNETTSGVNTKNDDLTLPLEITLESSSSYWNLKEILSDGNVYLNGGYTKSGNKNYLSAGASVITAMGNGNANGQWTININTTTYVATITNRNSFSIKKNSSSALYGSYSSGQNNVYIYKKAYIVTYDANGGTGTMTDSNSPYFMGSTVTTLSNTFTRSGYTFTGWNTAPDGSGTPYSEGAKFTPNANTTLYAQWTSSSNVATPTFYVPAGTYNTTQSVELNCGTDGATIYYTTNGDTPTTESSVYSSPIAVNRSMTIKAIGVKEGLTNSAEASATYTLKCTTPEITIPSGVFVSSKVVTITSSDGATIRYTTDGSTTPTTSVGTVYDPANKPSISATTTIKAIAYKDGWTNSDVASETFTKETVLDGLSGLVAQTNTSDQSYYVNLTDAQVTYVNGKHGYMEDGTAGIYIYNITPTKNKVYNGIFQITYQVYNQMPELKSITTIEGGITDGSDKAPTEMTASDLSTNFADNLGRQIQITGHTTTTTTVLVTGINFYTTYYDPSFEADHVYTIIGYPYNNNGTKQFRVVSAVEKPEAPTFTPAAGEFGSDFELTINAATGSTIYYTTNGDVPSESSTEYDPNNKPIISAGADVTVKAIAVLAGMTSSVGSVTYEYKAVSKPSFEPVDGTELFYGETVALACDVDGATIYYTTDGSTPDGESSVYSTPIAITANSVTIKAKAKKGDNWSSEASATFTLKAPEAPTADPAAGDVEIGTTVALSAAAGTTIYYTLDGSTPDNTSTPYTGTITIDAAKTIKAVAYDGAGNKGAVLTAAYTIVKVATPTFTPAETDFFESLEISINCVTDGATIYYTTNNEIPTTSSTEYTGPFTITATTKVMAIAVKANCNNSINASKTYTKQTVYSVADVKNGTATGTCYVKGYIVGSYNATTPKTGADRENSNLALADSYNETDGSRTIPVQLVKDTDPRTYFNVVEHPQYMGVTQVIVYGTLASYFSTTGFKPTTSITKVAEAASVTSVGVGTWASDSPLDFTGKNIKAYYATVEGSTLTFHEINKVPANTGVLLVKAGGATEAIPTFTDDADATTGNVFVPGTGAAVNYDAGGGYYNYVLFNGEDGIGFYQANNNTIAVNRAYVHVGGGLSVKSFSLNFDDETGISLTPAPSPEGEGRDAAWYDMTGRRVAQPTKGIYIHGGKKVMIK